MNLRTAPRRFGQGNATGMTQLERRVHALAKKNLFDDHVIRSIFFENGAQMITQREKPATEILFVINKNDSVIDMLKTFAVELDHAKARLERTRIDAQHNLLFSVHREIQVAGIFLVNREQILQNFSMSKVSAETIQQYEKNLGKDPNSKVFAALADAYREQGRVEEAEKMARDGVRRHPNYVGGYIALARIFLGSQRPDEAEDCLKKAIQLSPENLLAYQLLGQTFVELKRPQEALKAHKMVLFLNPLSEKSRQAVEKLETLSATDYDDELFEMRPLREQPVRSVDVPSKKLASSLERSLSFVDALLVRNELGRAKSLLQELAQQYPDSVEVTRRWSYFEDEGELVPQDEAIRPLMSREKRIWEKKKDLLENILARIHRHRQIHS